jgi:hypothetical protein
MRLKPQNVVMWCALEAVGNLTELSQINNGGIVIRKGKLKARPTLNAALSTADPTRASHSLTQSLLGFRILLGPRLTS